MFVFTRKEHNTIKELEENLGHFHEKCHDPMRCWLLVTAVVDVMTPTGNVVHLFGEMVPLVSPTTLIKLIKSYFQITKIILSLIFPPYQNHNCSVYINYLKQI